MTNGCRRNLELHASFDNILTREKVMFIYETIILGNSSSNGKYVSSHQLAGDSLEAVAKL